MSAKLLDTTRAAIEALESTLRTNSRDIQDWRDDVADVIYTWRAGLAEAEKAEPVAWLMTPKPHMFAKRPHVQLEQPADGHAANWISEPLYTAPPSHPVDAPVRPTKAMAMAYLAATEQYRREHASPVVHPGSPVELVIAGLRAALAAAPAAPAQVALTPLTLTQIHAIWRETAAEVQKMEAEQRYSFAGWLPVAVRLVEKAHGIGGQP